MSLQRYASRILLASLSPMFEFAARFVRTVFLSHMLLPADLGASVALVTILVSCEVITDVGLDKFIMVHAAGDRAQAVAAAQQIAIVRGTLIALFIALAAPWLAQILGAGDHHVASIRWIGLVPLVRYFRNWRTVQIQAEYRYGPETVANVSAQICAVLVVVPAAWWFEDERAMLVSLFVEVSIYTVLSHVLVSRVHVTALDPAMRKAALAFGLPLMINGLALVCLSQLDRFIVGNIFGLETLALYTLAMSLAIVPISPLVVMANNIGLAFLGRWRAEVASSQNASLIVVSGLTTCAAAYAAGVAVFLDRLIPLFYGAHYQITPLFSALATFVALVRMSRIGPSIVLLAFSRTMTLTLANLLGGLGMAVGLVAAIWSHRVEAVVLGTLLGDLFSLIALLHGARGYLPIRTALLRGTLVSIPIVMITAGMLSHDDFGIGMRALLLAVATVVIGLGGAWQYRSFSLATTNSSVSWKGNEVGM